MRRPFEPVVVEHGPRVLRVCRAVLGDHVDAEEAWSETFLSALRAWPELDDGADVGAWLVTIAHRKAIDVTRARTRRPVPVAEPPERRSTSGLPGVRDEHAELWAAVAALPDKQRHAIAYHHIAGLPYDRVAELLGGSPTAARRAAADGVATLRRRLDRDDLTRQESDPR